MEKRMSAGFILGFIGGFINFLYALLAAYGLFSGLSDPRTGAFAEPVVIMIVLIIIPLTNFIGSCICRNKPAAGRALMYATGLLLLILFITGLSNIIGIAPKQYLRGIPAHIIILYAVMITAQGLSIAAAALLSVPAGKEQTPEYGGMLKLYQYDTNETPKQEFQAVHRLYNLTVNTYDGPKHTMETKPDDKA